SSRECVNWWRPGTALGPTLTSPRPCDSQGVTTLGKGVAVTDFDVHIKGGTVVDGTRVPRYRGDVWVKEGRIAQIGGRPRGTADRVIDAAGMIVAPGFVDL